MTLMMLVRGIWVLKSWNEGLSGYLWVLLFLIFYESEKNWNCSLFGKSSIKSMSQCAFGESQPFTVWCLDSISKWPKGVIKSGN